ncbi:MAG: hypothetical protein JHD28_04350 [Bacteroidia bacterium]|nr:hypothetical protein [Bacteroidia bacterium]
MFFFTLFNLFGQNVVISEYFNEADTRDEWTELLVIADNTDLRNYKLRDNNTSQDNWQTEITFSNVSLWNNLRAGTIIVIWHRKRSSTVSSDRLVDTLKSDGYIEVHSQLNGYFSGGDFGTSPNWAGSSLAIGGSGEIIQLLDASNNHIFALGHKSTITNSGNDFAAISSSNKLNHASAIISGSNISITPGANIAAYIGGTSDTLKTSEGSSYLTQGLPNKRVSDSTSNQNYWRSLRQPIYTNPTLNAISTDSNGTQFNLSWSSCTDPNPSDSTTGYLILRNTTNSFTDPTDNTIYNDGNTIGTATVVKHINFSSTLAFTDNYNLNCGGTLYYKIYAFRYKADNNNVINMARGRAYNETGTNVQSIVKNQPVSQNILAN